MKRPVALALLALGLTGTASAAAWYVPDAAFVQAGGGEGTQAITIGAQWMLPWRSEWAGGELSAYMDASLGRWFTDDESGARSTAWVTQLGLTPVLRYRGHEGGSPWFAEAGIGVNVLAPVFHQNERSFSTAFNFGDHIAVGRSFGADRRQEISLRVQHFSNAGIKHPNPGINFLQLRYSVAF